MPVQHHAGGAPHFAHEGRREQDAVVGQRGVGRRYLDRGNRQLVAHGEARPPGPRPIGPWPPPAPPPPRERASGSPDRTPTPPPWRATPAAPPSPPPTRPHLCLT